MMESETQESATATAPEPVTDFDLRSTEIPSFGALQTYRSEIFSNHSSVRTLEETLRGLGEDGEDGRRRGLGLWLLGKYAEAAEQLAGYADDDVASYTRARALMSLEQPEQALPLFQRLADSYPEEPRPRSGLIEARLESTLSDTQTDPQAATSALESELASADKEHLNSPEYCYLRGRLEELGRNWQGALDLYLEARELDPYLRSALFRAAYVAERGGLDELAMELYQDLSRMKPIDRSVLINLGVLYEDLGRDQDAAACYETIVRTYPTDVRARLYLEDARKGMDMYYDEDQERKEDRLNQILRIPITDFELSVRARNCLSKMDICTLGDLVCRTEHELLSYKNFGETSLNEIKEILHSKGLRLGMPREEAVASVEHHAMREFAPSGGGDDLLNKPITELQLSIRARRTVESLGALTLGDISKHSIDELLGMPNFGVTSLQELRGKLAEYGLKLRGE